MSTIESTLNSKESNLNSDYLKSMIRLYLNGELDLKLKNFIESEVITIDEYKNYFLEKQLENKLVADFIPYENLNYNLKKELQSFLDLNHDRHPSQKNLISKIKSIFS